MKTTATHIAKALLSLDRALFYLGGNEPKRMRRRLGNARRAISKEFTRTGYEFADDCGRIKKKNP